MINWFSAKSLKLLPPDIRFKAKVAPDSISDGAPNYRPCTHLCEVVLAGDGHHAMVWCRCATVVVTADLRCSITVPVGDAARALFASRSSRCCYTASATEPNHGLLKYRPWPNTAPALSDGGRVCLPDRWGPRDITPYGDGPLCTGPFFVNRASPNVSGITVALEWSN